MKALTLKNGILAEEEIENTLESLQKIVGGYIEIPYLSNVFSDNDILIIINEEGKLIGGLNKEIAIVDEENNRVLDIVYGNCIFVSRTDDGDMKSLTNEQIKVIKHKLRIKTMLSDCMVRVLFV